MCPLSQLPKTSRVYILNNFINESFLTYIIIQYKFCTVDYQFFLISEGSYHLGEYLFPTFKKVSMKCKLLLKSFVNRN